MAIQLLEEQNPDEYRCPNLFLTTSFIRSTCIDYRVIINTSGSSTVLKCIENKNCISEGCCRYGNMMCIDANGNPEIYYYDIGSNNECSGPPPTFTECFPETGDVVMDSGCLSWCIHRY
jgi:hypothetical protein